MTGLLIPLFHLLFGLITTFLFCTAVGVAAKRAPRHLLWLGLIAAGSVCSSTSGIVNLFFMNLMQQGRKISEMNGVFLVQGGLSSLSVLLMCGGAVALLVLLLNERAAATTGAVAPQQPWQNR